MGTTLYIYIKHIQQFEQVGSYNGKPPNSYILNDFTSDHKSWIQLLSLTYLLDLNDVMFFIKSLKNYHNGFNIE